MKTVEDALGSIDAAMKRKSKAGATGYEQHGIVLYQYAMYQVYRDEKDLGKLEYALHQLIDQLLRGHPGAAGALSLPVIADLYRQELVTASLHTHIRELDHHLFYAATLMLQEQDMGFTRGALGFVHYFIERLPDAQLEKYLRSMLPDLLNSTNSPLLAASSLSATIDSSSPPHRQEPFCRH